MPFSPSRLEIEQTIAIAALAAAIELHDVGTPGHNARVADLAQAIGRELGLDMPTIRVLARAGLLHDLGKLGISDAILYKPGKLSDVEQMIMQRHPGLGLEVLDRIGGLEREKQVVFGHHERLDGSGYPRKLTAEFIPIEVRIVAVADTYDAMISDRPYRAGVGTPKAFEVMHEEAGKALDSDCVQALISVVDKNTTLFLPSLPELPYFKPQGPERRQNGGNRRSAGLPDRRATTEDAAGQMGAPT